MTFGALAYKVTPADDWARIERQHACEAVANSNPTATQLRCVDGRTIGQAKLAGDTAARPAH